VEVVDALALDLHRAAPASACAAGVGRPLARARRSTCARPTTFTDCSRWTLSTRRLRTRTPHANTEVCLLATRGSPMRLAKDVHQVVIAPVGAPQTAARP
jgi:hypothetical protein